MFRTVIALAILALSMPAQAKVQEAGDSGFVLRYVIDAPAAPDDAWAVLVDPAQWWSKAHSYSGDAANFSLDPRAGGCFCEVLRNELSPNAAPRGSVEHMRVVYVERPRALRMSGALGPLQSGAATGMLTVFLRPHGSGTRILWEYVVGGYLRSDPAALADSVDRILTEQVLRLGERLGAGVAAGPPPAQEPAEAVAGIKSEFEREMESFLEEGGGKAGEAAPAPSGHGLPPAEPEQPVFIGR